MNDKKYHHGDLRAALLTAAGDLLAERGPDGFSLRDCARRAGVSHAAPAYHFGDLRGLLTAVATEGFTHLAASLRAARLRHPSSADEAMLATGIAYVEQAVRAPGPFRVMFRPTLLDGTNPHLQSAGNAAWAELAACLPSAQPGTEDSRCGNASSPPPAQTAEAAYSTALPPQALLAWSVVHGLASLILDGPLTKIYPGPPQEIARALAPVVLRAMIFPQGRN